MSRKIQIKDLGDGWSLVRAVSVHVEEEQSGRVWAYWQPGEVGAYGTDVDTAVARLQTAARARFEQLDAAADLSPRDINSLRAFRQVMPDRVMT